MTTTPRNEHERCQTCRNILHPSDPECAYCLSREVNEPRRQDNWDYCGIAPRRREIPSDPSCRWCDSTEGVESQPGNPYYFMCKSCDEFMTAEFPY